LPKNLRGPCQAGARRYRLALSSPATRRASRHAVSRLPKRSRITWHWTVETKTKQPWQITKSIESLKRLTALRAAALLRWGNADNAKAGHLRWRHPEGRSLPRQSPRRWWSRADPFLLASAACNNRVPGDGRVAHVEESQSMASGRRQSDAGGELGCGRLVSGQVHTFSMSKCLI
jgi:hypothetical protein